VGQNTRSPRIEFLPMHVVNGSKNLCHNFLCCLFGHGVVFSRDKFIQIRVHKFKAEIKDTLFGITSGYSRNATAL
jgi:hypothetical protein